MYDTAAVVGLLVHPSLPFILFFLFASLVSRCHHRPSSRARRSSRGAPTSTAPRRSVILRTSYAYTHIFLHNNRLSSRVLVFAVLLFSVLAKFTLFPRVPTFFFLVFISFSFFAIVVGGGGGVYDIVLGLFVNGKKRVAGNSLFRLYVCDLFETQAKRPKIK